MTDLFEFGIIFKDTMLSQILKEVLTIHFEEHDLANAWTNIILGFAQKMTLRLLADFLKENGSVGK